MMGSVLAFFSGACTGLTVAVGKMAAAHMSAAMYVFLISFFSLIMMYFWRAATVGIKLPMPHPELRWLLFWQSACSAFALWSFWEGARQINTGIASFVVRTELVFVLIASRLIFREKIGYIGILGCSLIIAGSAAMGWKSEAELLSIYSPKEASVYLYGLSIVIFSGLGFAASECFAKLLANRIEPSELVIWRGLSLGAIFAVLAYYEGGAHTWKDVSAQDVFICALAAILGPILARILFMISLRKIDLGKAYLICQNEPIVTALFAWILMDEKMRPNDVGGALLILIGCFMISLPGRSKARHSG